MLQNTNQHGIGRVSQIGMQPAQASHHLVTALLVKFSHSAGHKTLMVGAHLNHAGSKTGQLTNSSEHGFDKLARGYVTHLP